MTDSWICEGGHPYYLHEGKKVCSVCDEIKEHGLRKRPCRLGGHAMPANREECLTCKKYRLMEWHRELDKTGKAICKNGHEVTHETMRYSLIRPGVLQRACGGCVNMSANMAASVNKKKAAHRHAAGLTRRRPPKKTDALDHTYVDWVVVYRLAMGKVDEVYDMKRGDTVGATAMEKWVAYHSTPEDYLYTRNFPAGPATVRWQWREYGIKKKWEPKTLVQVIAET